MIAREARICNCPPSMRIACSSLSSAKALGADPTGKLATFSRAVLGSTLCLDSREALVDALMPRSTSVDVLLSVAIAHGMRLLRVDELGEPMRVLLPVAGEGRLLHRSIQYWICFSFQSCCFLSILISARRPSSLSRGEFSSVSVRFCTWELSSVTCWSFSK